MISTRAGIYLALSFLLIFLGVGFLNSFRVQSELDRYIEEYNRFKAEAELTLVYADSIQNEIENYVTIVDELRTNLESVEKDYENSTRRIRDLERERNDARVQVTDSIIEITPPEVLEYVDALENENIELRLSIEILEEINNNKSQQINSLAAALELQTARADSLYIIVQNIPDAPVNTDKIFGFIKPSRLSSFLIGAATASVIILSR